MGDLNAVGLAQTTHERILEKRGALDGIRLLRYGDRLPISELMVGVYVDDLIDVQKLLGRLWSRGQGADYDVLRLCEAGYAAANLPRAIDKSFHGVMDFVAWGTSVNGDAGRVGVSAPKRLQLSVLTWACLCL